MTSLGRAACCALLSLAGVPALAQERVTAFVDVTLIPMDRERSVPHQTVLVRGDRMPPSGRPIASRCRPGPRGSRAGAST